MKMRFSPTVQPEMPMSNRTVKKAPLVRPPRSQTPARAPAKKAPIVRLPPKSDFERFLAQGSQGAVILLSLLATIVALDYGEYVLAPLALGVLIGLMLGPLAAVLERHGFPPGLSAFVVYALFI